MKKVAILFLAAFCLLQTRGFSQKTEVGIAGGVTSSNIYGHIGGNDTRGDVRGGFTLGMLVDAPIRKSNFSFQPGLHYVQKGDFSSKSANLKNAVALRYAELQANFIHYTKGKGKARLYFGLGPTLGLPLPSKKVAITDDAKTATSISFGKTNANDYRGVDFGANGLMGIRFRNGIIATINYTFGLRNLIPVPASNDDVLRNGCFSFRIGYIFKNPVKK